MAEFNIKKLRSGGLITNYFCTSNCKHCLYNSSPRWEKRYIDSNAAQKSLLKICSLGCRAVHIGGGEPLLKPDKLGTVLEIAPKIGVSVEYVETNYINKCDLCSEISTYLIANDYSDSTELRPVEFYIQN